MRKLQTQDVFKLARIIKQANMKDHITKFTQKGKTNANSSKEEKEKAAEEIGVDVFLAIVEACGDSKIEELLYDLIGGVAEKKPDEIKEQSLETTIEQVKQIIKENNITTFFSTASRLTT